MSEPNKQQAESSTMKMEATHFLDTSVSFHLQQNEKQKQAISGEPRAAYRNPEYNPNESASK
jgi:hypothetical protein